MTLLQTIQEISQGVEGYTFKFGEEGMDAILSDNTKLPCIYFEEYRKCSFSTGTYKSTPPSVDAGQFMWFRTGVVTPPDKAPKIWSTPAILKPREIVGPEGQRSLPGPAGVPGQRGIQGIQVLRVIRVCPVRLVRQVVLQDLRVGRVILDILVSLVLHLDYVAIGLVQRTILGLRHILML